MKAPSKIIFFLMFMGIIPVSCDRCSPSECCGDGPPARNFYIKTFSISVMDINTRENTDTALYHNYRTAALTLFPDELQYASLKKELPPVSFSSVAYACSPALSIALHEIVDIKIMASNSFQLDSQEPVVDIGDDITSLFEVSQNSYSFESIPDFVLGKKTLQMGQPLYIKLKETALQVEIKLDLEVTMSDQANFVFEDQRLRLTPY